MRQSTLAKKRLQKFCKTSEHIYQIIGATFLLLNDKKREKAFHRYYLESQRTSIKGIRAQNPSLQHGLNQTIFNPHHGGLSKGGKKNRSQASVDGHFYFKVAAPLRVTPHEFKLEQLIALGGSPGTSTPLAFGRGRLKSLEWTPDVNKTRHGGSSLSPIGDKCQGALRRPEAQIHLAYNTAALDRNKTACLHPSWGRPSNWCETQVEPRQLNKEKA
ncbi:uncharacterized protein LOC144201772 [Stigmatopora nigra]